MEKTIDKKTVSILIVEDEPEIASFLKTLISEIYRVSVISDGKTALKHLGENVIDIVVLDYRLPDMSGLEVLKEIKRIRPGIPVIFITGYGDEDVAVKAFRYGARDYLKKPFNYNEFLNTIELSLSLASMDKVQPRRVLTAETDQIASDFIHVINNSITKYNLQKALIYINNNYMTKITLDKVAKESCTSKHHLSREFRKSIGCTYQDYLNQLRMKKAKELLEKTNLSITEAAFSAGYTDLTHFERIFKKITGCTPKEYKIRRKQDQTSKNDFKTCCALEQRRS